jgi:hypothetical protein
MQIAVEWREHRNERSLLQGEEPIVLSRAITPKRKGRNWLTALAALSILTGTLVFTSTGLALTQSEFELDKDAQANVLSRHLGTLKGNHTASATSITICTFVGGVYPAAAPFTILIDGEQMTVTAIGAATNKTGGCGFGDPALIASGTRAYTVTRGANTTTAAAHSGGADVTQLVSGTFDGDDWSDVYAAVLADPNTKCASLGAVECAWIADPKATDNTYFTGGGSKDDLDINDQGDPAVPDGPWLSTDSSVPPSDEILDGFAAKYNIAGRELLFFGADRWTTNGAKDFGFWFFKNEVSVDTVTNTFEGTHTVGDILILGTFTQGGAVSSIRVFSWVGTGGDVNGVLQTEGNFGDCVPGGGTSNGCNTVNDTTILSPWPYQGGSTGNVAGSIYAGGMLEGGIDLTAMGLTGCFSSFMAETRSSPQIGAQLKDFVLGTFESCEASITTQVSDTEFEIGGSVTDSATVSANGPAPTGDVDFYLCGPEEGIATCDASGTFVSSEDLGGATVNGQLYTVTSDSVTPTSAGDYCFYAEYPAAQDPNYPDGAFPIDSANECFTVTPQQPTISTEASSAGPDPLGTSIDDTAHLGNVATPSNGQNGTITFTAYGPHADGTTCTTVAYTSVVNVTGSGDYVASSGSGGTFTPTVAGNYNWIASYTPDAGDVNNLAVSGSCGDANEGSVIEPNQPTISTEVDDAGPLPLGSSLDDTAHLGNVATPSNGLNGTITFTAYGPHSDATTCTTAAYTSVVDVSGNGDYTASSGTGGTFTPTEAGNYNWIAAYTPDAGDVNNLPVSGSCGDANEGSVIISLQPDISTAQDFVPNDSATITVGTAGGALAGDVVFELFVNDTDCSGTAAYTSSAIDITTGTGGNFSRTVASDNSTAYDTDGTTFSWRVTFTSTNPAHEDVVSDCTEQSSIAITN